MDLDINRIVSQDYLETQLLCIKDKAIYLYGAGSFGRETYYLLQSRGIDICGFLDQRASQIKEYCGKPVYTLDSSVPSKGPGTLVLFAIVMDKNERKRVIQNIQKAGFPRIMEAQFYRSLQIVPDDLDRRSLQEYYVEKSGQIECALRALKDEKSRRIYEANIKAHFQKDFSDCVIWEDPMEEQYFPNDLKLVRGYRRFVDCGGYIGDTVEALLKSGASVDSVAVFEPDLANFDRLTNLCRRKEQKILAFPCAVSDRTCFHKFSAAQGSGTICADGEATVLCVSLDETLIGFQPTFIKMDIEGAELAALQGAKNIIYTSTPDLAICVYHKINHLWDILLLLQSWNLGYQFYLRSYNAYTMETVLYATKSILRVK